MYNINYVHLHVQYMIHCLLIYCRNISNCLVSIGLDLVTIMLEYGACHHLLMVCYITIETMIINVHVLEIHKMNEEH